MNPFRLGGGLVVLHLLDTGAVLATPPVEYGKIEILRDQWGIPHIFSDTDAGALYGLGYFTAEERGSR